MPSSNTWKVNKVRTSAYYTQGLIVHFSLSNRKNFHSCGWRGERLSVDLPSTDRKDDGSSATRQVKGDEKVKKIQTNLRSVKQMKSREPGLGDASNEV